MRTLIFEAPTVSAIKGVDGNNNNIIAGNKRSPQS